LDLLSRSNGKKLDAGIEKAKDQAQAVFKMAQNILEPKQVSKNGVCAIKAFKKLYLPPTSLKKSLFQ